MIEGLTISCRVCGRDGHLPEAADWDRQSRNNPDGPGVVIEYRCPRCKVRGAAPVPALAIAAIARPRAAEIMIAGRFGTFCISAADARALHAAIGGALTILDGQHPAQTGDDA